MFDLIFLLLVFLGTGLLAYRFIRRVPPRLHTPLMSMTNAISAVIILGALLLFSSPRSGWETVAGAVALAAAAFNIVGGFALTDRMLHMFKDSQGSSRVRSHRSAG